jgi:5-methylcytosine-specific restriction endonuclease McrA
MPYIDHAKQNEYQRKWLAVRRTAWLAANGPCVTCGSVEDLQVDHRDPALKVDHKVWSWSEERRAAELAKCQVLCKQCHLEKTVTESVAKLDQA